MATTPKTGGRRGRPPAKPATIDLEAKKVSKPDASSEKTTPKRETKSQTFGRDAARGSGSGSKSASTSKPAAATAKPDSKKQDTSPAAKKPEEPKSKPPVADAGKKETKSRSGLTAGLIGASIAVLGLGALGQHPGAKNIPLIGTLYSGTPAPAQDQTQLDAINSRLDELAAKVGSGDSAPDETITALDDRLSKLENAEPGLPASDNGRLDEFETKLQGLADSIASLPAAGETSTDNTAVQNLIDQVTRLEAGLSENEPVDIKPLEESLASIRNDLSGLQEAISGNTGAIQEIAERSAQLATEMEAVRINRKVAGTIAVNALEAALQSGESLSVPISSLEALSGQTEETTRLAELSKAGIPTIAELDAELAAIADTIQNPVTTTQDASITDRLWANARSLVTVRTSGPREGTSASAVLSRVKAHLNDGNFAGVKAEWDELPESISAANAGWIEKLDVRLEAAALVQKLSDNLSGLAG